MSNQIKSFLGMFLFIVLIQSSALADCNYSCTVSGPGIPCPTWSEPLRTCPSSYDDPACLTKRSLCHGTFAACVTSALVTEGAGAGCAAAVVADVETGGVVTAATVGICGVAAAALQQVANNCN